MTKYEYANQIADKLETHNYPNDTIIFEASATLREQAKEIEHLKEFNMTILLQNKRMAEELSNILNEKRIVQWSER